MPSDTFTSLQDRVQLVIADSGVSCEQWDAVEIDSDIQTPADAWSLTLFNPVPGSVPEGVAAGAAIYLTLDGERLLTGVIDRVRWPVIRAGTALAISGRDLAGQLLDCSVELFAGREMSLQEIVGQFMAGSSSPLPKELSFADGPEAKVPATSLISHRTAPAGTLSKRVATEPGESIWVAIQKAAEASGQYVWMEPDGTVSVGNPFAVQQPAQSPVLRLFRAGVSSDGQPNTVLELDYTEDGSDEFTEIHILGQDNDSGRSFSARRKVLTDSQRVLPDERKAAFDGQAKDKTEENRLGRKRLRVVVAGQVDNQAHAELLADKAMADAHLASRTLTAKVAGWRTAGGEVWRTGWAVSLESDALPDRALAQWVISKRTLVLSRDEGQFTRLTLKRAQDWMQPPAHTDVFKDQAYRDRKKAQTKRKRQATAKAARLAKAAASTTYSKGAR